MKKLVIIFSFLLGVCFTLNGFARTYYVKPPLNCNPNVTKAALKVHNKTRWTLYLINYSKERGFIFKDMDGLQLKKAFKHIKDKQKFMEILGLKNLSDKAYNYAQMLMYFFHEMGEKSYKENSYHIVEEASLYSGFKDEKKGYKYCRFKVKYDVDGSVDYVLYEIPEYKWNSTTYTHPDVTVYTDVDDSYMNIRKIMDMDKDTK